MNRVELVETIATKNELTKAAAGRILDTVIDSIVGTVKKGGTVSLVGFGTFKLVSRAARKGFNPQTKEAVKIPASKVPKFTPGAGFKASVDAKFAARKAEKAAASSKKTVAKKKPAVRKAA